MRETPQSLDLIFLRHGRVVGMIEHAAPLSDAPLSVATPADQVLELAAGSVQRYRVDFSTRLRCPDGVANGAT